MMAICSCVADFNAKLAAYNTRIIETMGFPRDGSPIYSLPKIEVEKIETRKRLGPAIAIPTFCPFCSVRYEPEPAVAKAEAA